MPMLRIGRFPFLNCDKAVDPARNKKGGMQRSTGLVAQNPAASNSKDLTPPVAAARACVTYSDYELLSANST
jgi:hypothetical protein